MPKLPAITPKKLLKILESEGFYIHHQAGSHLVLKRHDGSLKRITLPFHNKDLKKKTLISILKQAGLDKNILHK